MVLLDRSMLLEMWDEVDGDREESRKWKRWPTPRLSEWRLERGARGEAMDVWNQAPRGCKRRGSQWLEGRKSRSRSGTAWMARDDLRYLRPSGCSRNVMLVDYHRRSVL